MAIYLNPPPSPPLSRIITEGTIGDCPKCRSTRVRKTKLGKFFGMGKKGGCIQPKCDNYYKGIIYIREKVIEDILS